MNRRQCLRRLSLASLATLVGCGCHSAPTTGRKQLLLMPEGQEVSLGADAFHQMLEDEPDSQNTHWVELVERVGHRIAAQSDRPLRMGIQSGLKPNTKCFLLAGR